MVKITKEQYEFALARIEELLPMVDDNTPANDRNAVELTMMSDVVIDYEKEHYPIGKPTVAQLIQSHPGAEAGPKGWAVRPLKWYASWVQNVVRQFGPYPSRA